MFPAVPTDTPWLLFALALGLLGSIACTATEVVVARFLPRAGKLPGVGARTTTAALTGVLCTALALRLGPAWDLPAFLLLAVMAVQLGRIDLTHHILPNPLVLVLLLGGVTFLTLSTFASGEWAALLQSTAGAGILLPTYFLLALISPAGIGMGDVKLAAPVGLFLGYLGWGELFYGGALAFVVGGVVSAVLVGLRRVPANAEIAFGPSMLGTTICIALFSS